MLCVNPFTLRLVLSKGHVTLTLRVNENGFKRCNSNKDCVTHCVSAFCTHGGSRSTEPIQEVCGWYKASLRKRAKTELFFSMEKTKSLYGRDDPVIPRDEVTRGTRQCGEHTRTTGRSDFDSGSILAFPLALCLVRADSGQRPNSLSCTDQLFTGGSANEDESRHGGTPSPPHKDRSLSRRREASRSRGTWWNEGLSLGTR